MDREKNQQKYETQMLEHYIHKPSGVYGYTYLC